jgi:uncharacterized protein (DUF433 family)
LSIEEIDMSTLDITVAEAPPLCVLPDGAMRVRGTRVSLDTVIRAFDEGCTPEEIRDDYPTLQLADIYAIIAFYLRHREDVFAYLQESQQKADEIRRKIEAACPPDGLRERLVARWEEKQKQAR